MTITDRIEVNPKVIRACERPVDDCWPGAHTGMPLSERGAHLRHCMLRATAMALAVASFAFSTVAVAGGRFHSRPAVGQPVIGVHAAARPIIPLGPPHSSFSRSRFHGRFTSGGVPIVFAAPPAAYLLNEAPPAYLDPSAAPAPPASSTIVVAPPPPPPPPERDVVQYSAGRYELRGDGLTTPYRWVWIPNPPPPPKSAGDTRDTALYGWVDEDGVMHVTDRWGKIPPQYREQAKRNKAS
jgi:hypothetical protein